MLTPACDGKNLGNMIEKTLEILGFEQGPFGINYDMRFARLC